MSRSSTTVAVAVIGAGTRCQHVYGPLLQMLPTVELAGIHSPRRERAAAVADCFGTQAYDQLDDLLGDTKIDALIASVRWSANPEVYRRLASWDRPVLLETPLSADPDEAALVASALAARRCYTDIAEQYHCRPVEMLKRELLTRGVFGTVRYAFSDGVGHEYHGLSLLRSYLGWPTRAHRILALERDLPLADHWTHRKVFFEAERVQHAIIEFEGGGIGAYRWSWLNYESPIHTHRSAGFEGTRGAAWGAELVGFTDPERPDPLHYRLDHRTRIVDGLEVPAEIAVLVGDRCVTKWCNPHADLPLDMERITAAGFVDNLVAAVQTGGTEPLYPVWQAAADHAVVGAMYTAFKSAE